MSPIASKQRTRPFRSTRGWIRTGPCSSEVPTGAFWWPTSAANIPTNSELSLLETPWSMWPRWVSFPIFPTGEVDDSPNVNLDVDDCFCRCFLEAAAVEYTQIGEPNSEHLLKMRQVSPIQHAHKVKAPTMLQIGSKDLRVPASQGLEYYYRLKANGVTTKWVAQLWLICALKCCFRLNLYEDNHPLGSVPNEMDNLINTLLWIEKHISGEAELDAK